MSIQKKLDERDFRYLQFVVDRAHGATDEQIVKELGDPDIDSPQVLYRRLKNDGHLICPVCSTTYVEEGHCGSSGLQRRARGSEVEERELPAVSDKVVEAFKDVISDLSSAVDSLPFVKQWLKDGRFTTEVVYTKDSGRANFVYRREDFRDAGGEVGLRWEMVCEEHGQDPGVQEFKEPIYWTQRGGADWYPHDVLTQLVSAYAVTGRSLGHLLEELHPDAQIADTDAAEKKRDELLHKARQLAALVRGNQWAVKRGRKAETVTPDEQIFATWQPDNLKKLGMDQEEIERLTGLRLPRHEHKS